VSDLRYVSNTGVIEAYSLAWVDVQCAPGESVLSGGGSAQVGYLYASLAIAPQGWRIRVENPSGYSGAIFVSALCGKRTGATLASASPSGMDLTRKTSPAADSGSSVSLPSSSTKK
jgi:hypothetical protein